MKSKVKILAITLVIVAVASVFLYAPLTKAFQPNGDPESDVEILNDMNFEARCRCKPQLKAPRVWWFLNHSEPTEVDGAAVVLFKNMLIVDTGEGQIRIHLPQAWTVDGEVMMREELFESGYLSEGETITVKALRANVIDKQGLCVYLLLGYEIINESTVHAYAILPQHRNLGARFSQLSQNILARAKHERRRGRLCIFRFPSPFLFHSRAIFA